MRLLFKKHVIKNVFILGMGVTNHDNIIDNIENEKENLRLQEYSLKIRSFWK